MAPTPMTTESILSRLDVILWTHITRMSVYVLSFTSLLSTQSEVNKYLRIYHMNLENLQT
jgi:hypothetical protein